MPTLAVSPGLRGGWCAKAYAPRMEGIERQTDTFTDNEPGESPLEIKLVGEEWAHPDDMHRAVVIDEHVTAEGRVLHPGDVITPRQARAERIRFQELPVQKTWI